MSFPSGGGGIMASMKTTDAGAPRGVPAPLAAQIARRCRDRGDILLDEIAELMGAGRGAAWTAAATLVRDGLLRPSGEAPGTWANTPAGDSLARSAGRPGT